MKDFRNLNFGYYQVYDKKFENKTCKDLLFNRVAITTSVMNNVTFENCIFYETIIDDILDQRNIRLVNCTILKSSLNIKYKNK